MGSQSERDGFTTAKKILSLMYFPIILMTPYSDEVLAKTL